MFKVYGIITILINIKNINVLLAVFELLQFLLSLLSVCVCLFNFVNLFILIS